MSKLPADKLFRLYYKREGSGVWEPRKVGDLFVSGGRTWRITSIGGRLDFAPGGKGVQEFRAEEVAGCQECGRTVAVSELATLTDGGGPIRACSECRARAVPPAPLAFPDLAGQMLAYECGELDTDATLALFQHLVDSGLAWTLPGRYGRTAAELLRGGHLQPFPRPIGEDREWS
jgi:hypothetical protein